MKSAADSLWRKAFAHSGPLAAAMVAFPRLAVQATFSVSVYVALHDKNPMFSGISSSCEMTALTSADQRRMFLVTGFLLC